MDSFLGDTDQSISEQMMSTFGQLAPLLDKTLNLAPNPRRAKAPRRGGPSTPEADEVSQAKTPSKALQLINTMAHLLIRHDQEMHSLRRTDQFILFLNPDPTGALHLLVQESTQWRQGMETKPQQLHQPLRQHLVLALIKSLHVNAGKIVESKDTEPLYQTSVQMGLILADRSFPFHRWDQHQQKLVIDKKQPISAQKMFQHLTELQETLLDKEIVVRFHALSAPKGTSTKAVPWRLQINLRSDRVYDLLFQLCHCSVWMAVGATMKPHSLNQSPMATTLQTLMGSSKGKGRGKGQLKGRTSPKQET